jgi:TRAP-type uncharacterized transport system substrate-binding protein
MGQGTGGYLSIRRPSRELLLHQEGISALTGTNAGTSAYLPLIIDMGGLDLGITNAIEVNDAANGTGDFEGRAPEESLPGCTALSVPCGYLCPR